MSNLLQIIIGMLIVGSCIYFFIYISEHEPNWSLNFMIKIILGGPIIWVCFLGVVFFCIVIGLPVSLFVLLNTLTDLILKSKEDKEDDLLETEMSNKNNIDW